MADQFPWKGRRQQSHPQSPILSELGTAHHLNEIHPYVTPLIQYSGASTTSTYGLAFCKVTGALQQARATVHSC